MVSAQLVCAYSDACSARNQPEKSARVCGPNEVENRQPNGRASNSNSSKGEISPATVASVASGKIVVRLRGRGAESDKLNYH